MPTDPAWDSSRKPLVAHWITPNGTSLFTINLHLTSKGGSSTTHANGRTPVNLGVEQRTSQVELVAGFVGDILAIDPEANIIVAGDFNEYTQTRSVFAAFDGVVTELDGAAGVPDVERYTYLYDQNSQQLDHAFASSAVVARGGVLPLLGAPLEAEPLVEPQRPRVGRRRAEARGAPRVPPPPTAPRPHPRHRRAP